MIGSPSPRDDALLPQQALPLPLVTRSAAWPYFSLTISLMSRSVMSASGKGSLAAPRHDAELGLGGERLHEPLHRFDGVRVQRVVHPPPLPAVGHDSRVLQRLEMERQT